MEAASFQWAIQVYQWLANERLESWPLLLACRGLPIIARIYFKLMFHKNQTRPQSLKQIFLTCVRFRLGSEACRPCRGGGGVAPLSRWLVRDQVAGLPASMSGDSDMVGNRTIEQGQRPLSPETHAV